MIPCTWPGKPPRQGHAELRKHGCFRKKYGHVFLSQTLFFPQGASTFEQLEKAELRSSRLTVDPSLGEKMAKHTTTFPAPANKKICKKKP